MAVRKSTWSLAVSLLLLASCGTSQPNDPENPDPGNTETATLRIELRGLTGREEGLIARYVIDDNPVQRANVIPPGISLGLRCGSLDPGDQVCDVPVQVGKVVSIFASERSPGSHRSVVNNVDLEVPGNQYEFIDWVGDCSTPGGFGFGDCAVTVSQPRTYNARADFTVMRGVVISQLGAGFTRERRDIPRETLSVPVSPNPLADTALSLPTGGLYAPTVHPRWLHWLPQGSTLFSFPQEYDINGHAVFLRWEGCDSESAGLCAVTFADGPMKEITAYFEYYICNGDMVAAPVVGQNCEKFTP